MKHNLLERHKVLENTLPTETLSDCIKEAKRQNKRRLLDPHPQIVHARSKQNNITLLQAHAITDKKRKNDSENRSKNQRGLFPDLEMKENFPNKILKVFYSGYFLYLSFFSILSRNIYDFYPIPPFNFYTM